MKFEKTTMTFPAEPPKAIAKPKHGEELHPNSLWFMHDPAIFQDPDTGKYYVYCTHRVGKKSDDLITWEPMKFIDVPPEDSRQHVGGDSIWAPDIVKVGNEYRLYCSNSSFGVRQSAIFLAVSDKPEGPFEPKGIVVKTSEKENSPVNAIDANIVEDVRTGKQYMTYGSFWGGIRILELDKQTGYAKEEGLGKSIACRPRYVSSAIEGPYIVYNEETDYYYLFVSYGSLNSDYNIRVGRSKEILGPYVDVNGREMTDIEDYDNEVGLMIACGYHFEGEQSYMGPGHNSVLHDKDGRWYLVCHIREHCFWHGEPSKMNIYQMYWTPDGWPVISPEVYAGEKMQDLDMKLVCGRYNRIKMIKTTPQGVLNSFPMDLFEDGRMNMGLTHGNWKMLDENTMSITYGRTEEIVKVAPAWDWERNEPTIIFTGKDERGICVFGKRV